MTNLIDISGLSDLDTKDVTSMRSTFSACNNLTDLTALKRWDTRNLIDVSCIFSRCTSLSDLTPLAAGIQTTLPIWEICSENALIF